jgi:hypothetical protein
MSSTAILYIIQTIYSSSHYTLTTPNIEKFNPKILTIKSKI